MPQASASSSSFGLINQGAAARPARSAAPLLSSANGRPNALSRRNSPTNHSGLTPCGRLPATTTASCPITICCNASSSSAWCLRSTFGPGPLRSVTRPLCSASLILLRVSPGTRIKASTKPRRANSASNGAALVAPRKPLTVTLWPRSASTWATFKPLPAAWLLNPRLRLTAPGCRVSRLTVRSRAGFRVRLRMRAISVSPRPGRAPPRRFPEPKPAAPGPGCGANRAHVHAP
ncbi:hypothetical protein D9M68_727350 [compost metagenome]